ncbi:hypothetical protein [Kaarinaea lacus]
MGVPTEEELQQALEEAGRMREQGEDPHHLAKTLLNHHYQIEMLEKVLRAAELYIHSGHAGTEHAALIRAIEGAKKARSDSGDHEQLDYGL